MMFLPDDKWSPRYEQQFYTIHINTYTKLDKPPLTESTFDDDSCHFLCSKPKFPAIYYNIEILCGTEKHTCLRRYSQFVSLSNKFDPTGKLGVRDKLPPKTGSFHNASEFFLDERMNRLYAFLREMLTRQEAVGSSLVEQFLELGVFKRKYEVSVY